MSGGRPLGLVVGTALVAGLATACLLGPLVLGPGPPADPVHAALLPPGTPVTAVHLADGRVLTAPDVRRSGDVLVVHGGRSTVEVPAADVTSQRRHRLWLGSDRFGQDLLRLMLVGGRVSLAVAALAGLVALVLGTAVGIVAATAGALADGLLMRFVDGMLAFPMLFLLILLAAVVEPGPAVLVALLGVSSWMGLARLVRGQMLSLRTRPFVLAGRTAGSPWHRMWRWHYLPHLQGPVAQDLALRLGDLVIAEATLSYLGLGVPATTPTWGVLVAEGHRVMPGGWWLSTLPGLAIVLLVVSLALVGDGLQTRRRGSA